MNNMSLEERIIGINDLVKIYEHTRLGTSMNSAYLFRMISLEKNYFEEVIANLQKLVDRLNDLPESTYPQKNL